MFLPNIILNRNLLILKNYTKNSYFNLIKQLLLFAVIGYFFIDILNDTFNGDKWCMGSLFFLFLVFLMSVRQRPLSFGQNTDLCHYPDIFDYLKNMMLQNLICWPAVLTLLIGIPVYFTYKHNLLDFILVIHAALVWWFTANFVVSLYKIKNLPVINSKFSKVIMAAFLITLFISESLEISICFEQLDFPAFKYIPLLGWLLELFSGDTTYIYLIYCGSLFACLSLAYLFLQRIKQNYSPSLVRERLFELTAEQNKSKEKRSLASLIKIPPLKIKSDYKFATALHYKNLCVYKQSGFLAYIDWIAMILLGVGSFMAVLDYFMSEGFQQRLGIIVLFEFANGFFWLYLFARKEKDIQPDLYFAMIPAPPHKKLNQMMCFGLLKTGITALLANLIIAALLKTNPLYALFFTFYAMAIYLFKITVCFLLRIFVKSSPKSDSFTIIQGAVSLIAGMILPGLIIGLLIHGFNIIALVISLFGFLQGVPLPQIKIILKYGITFFSYLSTYALFYAFFDKIYRKIDFGKN